MERKYQQLSFFLCTGIFFAELQGIYFKGYGPNGLEECFIESLDPLQNNFIMNKDRNALRPFRENVVEEGAGCRVYYCPTISSKVLALVGCICDNMNLEKFDFLYEYLEKNVQSLSPKEFIEIVNALTSLDANGVLDFVLWFCPLQQEDKVIALLQDQGLTEVAEKINLLKSLITLKIEGVGIPLSGILARHIPRINKHFCALNTGKPYVDGVTDFDLAKAPVLMSNKWYELCCKNNSNYSVDIPCIPNFDPEQYEAFFKIFFDLMVHYKNNNGSKEIVNNLYDCTDHEFVKFALFYLEYFEFFAEYINFNGSMIAGNPVTERCENLCKDINDYLMPIIVATNYSDSSPEKVLTSYPPHRIVSDYFRLRHGESKPSAAPPKQLSKKQKAAIVVSLTSVLAFTPWLVKKVKKWFKQWKKRNAALKAEKKSEVEAVFVKQ